MADIITVKNLNLIAFLWKTTMTIMGSLRGGQAIHISTGSVQGKNVRLILPRFVAL